MPRFDRTGPNGRGPMTGRGLGSCARSFRNGFRRALTKEEEKAQLKAEREEINKRLKELED
ncbi:MAG: DUF5320 domain-containing protein [Nanoarchaeota archaeon]|nr:DUF5320 domain-containing protein [Nanoarchaeota archaeon]